MKQYKTGLYYYKVWLHILTLYHSAFDLNFVSKFTGKLW